MKLLSFKIFLLFTAAVLLSSCLDTVDNTTPVSSDPAFFSLTLTNNDVVKSAYFTLVGDTIVNVDSLPYNTKVDSLYPAFRFNSTSRIILCPKPGSGTDSVNLTGRDTINFSMPVRIKNIATDLVASKEYTVIVNVHKVEPKFYKWTLQNNSIETLNAKNQKTVVMNDSLFYYLNNGTSADLFSSTDGKTWTQFTLTGFPVDNSFNDMLLFKAKLYFTQGGDKIYSSSNRKEWTTLINSDYNFKSLLFVFNANLWAVVQSKSDFKYRFATSTDGINWNIRAELPDGFPVRGFAAVSFTGRTGLPKVLLVGGYSSSDLLLKSRWSSEDGVYWVDFSKENRTLDTLAAGASLISYDNQLFAFGIRNDKNNFTTHYKKSIDEGFSWQTPDTASNRLRERIITVVSATRKDTSYIQYQARNYQSVVVMQPKVYPAVNSAALKNEIIKSNQIFIVGGKTANTVLSDVWRGKLNQKNFLRQ